MQSIQKRDMTEENKVIFTPPKTSVEQSQMAQFMAQVGREQESYTGFWQWSVQNKESFWEQVWDFCGVIGDKGDVVFKDAPMFKDAKFFPKGKINFAENLLRRRDDTIAISFQGEDKITREITFKELYDQVSKMRQALIEYGVTSGDRVAGFMPNMIETIVAMLAASSLGAIWSSASPDFGVQGVLDRFGQIEPLILFAVDGYYYNGKVIDCRDKVKSITAQLPSLKQVILTSYVGLDVTEIPAVPFQDVLQTYKAEEIEFERFEFNHPLYIMFSSGTTGVPKCIVHGTGGTLIQHLKEHQLQCDIRKGDNVFYFTTCGWMMWNWLVTALASEARLILYDGSPFYPNGYALWDLAEKRNCTFFGASAKYIDALRIHDIRVADRAGLKQIRMMSSTGSPLTHEGFDYVYNAVLPHVHLASISGGTDIVSCFVLGNPISPVYRGEIQGAGLGMDVDVFDEDGKPLPSGTGDLVCKTPFPPMPVGFWNDEDGSKYQNAYFGSYDGIWCHGDWCEWTTHHGMIIHGRSDATLNPGGVRIGTAEIYRIVEQLPEITESIAVGQNWEGDVRVVLFVTLKEGVILTDDLVHRIKTAVRAGATPRHVPAKVIAVADIPRTKSGKITEIAVKRIIHGQDVKNVEALANPAALALYKDLSELKD